MNSNRALKAREDLKETIALRLFLHSTHRAESRRNEVKRSLQTVHPHVDGVSAQIQKATVITIRRHVHNRHIMTIETQSTFGNGNW